VTRGGHLSEKAAPLQKCPICGQPSTPEARPFCSKRCAQIDLHRWLSGRYVIPAAQEEAASEEADGEDGRD
jgi:endogenous inhibitor of DNA gyrase (YacG/DUF329 family)